MSPVLASILISVALFSGLFINQAFASTMVNGVESSPITIVSLTSEAVNPEGCGENCGVLFDGNLFRTTAGFSVAAGDTIEVAKFNFITNAPNHDPGLVIAHLYSQHLIHLATSDEQLIGDMNGNELHVFTFDYVIVEGTTEVYVVLQLDGVEELPLGISKVVSNLADDTSYTLYQAFQDGGEACPGGEGGTPTQYPIAPEEFLNCVDFSDFAGAKAMWTQLDILAPDEDGDGIFNEVDTLPSTFSNDFSDVTLGVTTFGTITTRGELTLTITDATNPADGVKITADTPTGLAPAHVNACGGATSLILRDGDEVVLTCTSVTIEAISGSVEVEFLSDDGTIITTTLNEGDDVTFYESESGEIINKGEDTILISINGGKPISVDVDETVTLEELSFKVVICHNGQNTISISSKAVDEHLDHGDTRGPC